MPTAIWLNQPVVPIRRNLFIVQIDRFPLDSAGENRQAISGIWERATKSLFQQADQFRERQRVVEAVRRDASAIELQSTIMGSQPKALVNGTCVGIGETVASFRVLDIEPRRITVERDGVRLDIAMK
jgi:hypothetical protein